MIDDVVSTRANNSRSRAALAAAGLFRIRAMTSTTTTDAPSCCAHENGHHIEHAALPITKDGSTLLGVSVAVNIQGADLITEVNSSL